MSLSDLLDKSFGKKEATKEVKQETKKKQRTQRVINFGRDELSELKIALNYAINSIKRKSDVVQEKEDSTYFSYYKSWNKIRKKVIAKLDS